MSDYELHIAGQRIRASDLKFYSYFGFEEAEITVLERVVDPEARAQPGFVTEPFGVRTRVANMWADIQPFDGVLTGLPVPGNWHREASEWLGVARSVLSAQGRYRIMELGAGWGPACVAGAVMARRQGIQDIRMTAVEADPHHFGYLLQHVTDNGFAPADHVLLEAAVGPRDGRARFPDTGDAANTYGNRPLAPGEDDYLGRAITRTRPVKVLSFKRLLRAEPLWDLVHIDVQGQEFGICRSALREMGRRVARVCVGLHSRKLDGDLYDLFWRAGWLLENESPTRMRFAAGAKTLEALNGADGTQIWRNPRLRPEPVA